VDLDASAIGEARFRLLEPIRQYARERLAGQEATETHARHAAHYLALAERAAPELRTLRRGHWLDRLGADLGNVRAALRWLRDRALGATAATAESLVHLALGLMTRRHFAPARPLLDEALALYRTGGDRAGLGTGLGVLGSLLEEEGDLAGAIACAEESLALCR